MNTPKQIDTELARQHHEWHRIQQVLDGLTRKTQTAYGRRRHFSQGQGWETTDDEVWQQAEHEAANGDKYILGLGINPSYLIEHRDNLHQALAATEQHITELQAQYTGWNRFFVVTSSNGHIHSSMKCRSCRFTTQYGWLPELSGKTEEEAVAKYGTVLCSVCFPTAPVEHQGGRLTKAQALKASAA